MSILLLTLRTEVEEHVKGVNSIILSKLPRRCLNLHGEKDLGD